MSSHQIAMFTFTLGKDESIGPHALRRLWAQASGTGNIGVSRKEPAEGQRNRPIYTLYAPQQLDDLRMVEARLRHMLETAHLHASLTPMHA
ncbi:MULTISPECIES: hypothetical protein [Thermomonas]|jgi:hypothetical protein|uniref:Uncharacterized protein n=1 Tax=Thermomonas fusca TaxID=215690 RepID=A0A5R9PFE6_9GAMM|nr:MULTISPECIES: hypothetical protein [Thermomonas]TLX22239.1 hypothetical protein E5S66_06940 [Thermomonas fusca]